MTHPDAPRHLHDETAQMPVVRNEPRHAHRTGEQRAIQPWERPMPPPPTAYQNRIDTNREVLYPPSVPRHAEPARPSWWARLKAWFTAA